MNEYSNIPNEELIRMVDNIPNAPALLRELANRLDKLYEELQKEKHGTNS